MTRESSISIKSPEEIEILKQAGRILSAIIKELKGYLTEGTATRELDARAEQIMARYNVAPAFKGYRGYPCSICTSMNEEVVHGIPNERKLQTGDIVSLDVGILYKGYYADTAVTVGVGLISSELQKLLNVTHEALYKGIAQAQVNQRLSDISHAIQEYVEANNFSVVRDFVGHGIGRKLHEDPEVPNFGEPHQGPVLKEGMVFAIEPMVNLGTWKTRIDSDGWTVKTTDGKPSAHFEHTIAITTKGPLVLTE